MVIAREDRPGEPRLVGYVTGTAEPANVRAALAERLPALHGSGRGGGVDGAALDGQRQTRQAGPAGTGVRGHRSLPRSEHPHRGDPGRHLRPSARASSGSGLTTHSSIWVGIRCRRCAWSLRSTTTWTPAFKVRAVFEAPTVAQLALRIGAEKDRLEPLVAVERPAVVPLSFAQNRLWFIDQLQGPSPVYNLAVALRLRGRLDADALAAALADVVGRHESLRTLFVAPDGIPEQRVIERERADFGWQVVDATAWPASRLEEAVGEAARHTFDLAAEIPLRAKLFRVADDEHVFVAVAHHIAADGWSVAPLVNDLGAAYASRCAGQAPGWAELPVQYVDYTLWQRAQFGDLDDSQSRIAAQLGYWEQALAGMPERLALPPIGPIRWLPISAAPPWRWTGLSSCSSRLPGWLASTTRPASW